MNYNIGQEVWWARFESVESSVECPDCAGKCCLRIIMGDGTEVSIDCQNCHRGYEEFSRGRITTYERMAKAVKTTITGMDVTADKVEYRVPASYIVPEDRLFETEEEAYLCATELATDASRQELEHIASKEKDKRSWAWNATYHRSCIKRAEKEIEHHARKLDVANEKAKAQRKKA